MNLATVVIDNGTGYTLIINNIIIFVGILKWVMQEIWNQVI